ncbi:MULTISPECIES: bifunctional 3-(3-hydroxy-phenyl)propionate/3-hydroxycinnamic acid hydroxylase [Burkholderia]|uniref:3-(3-hydroxyphenyl)propionate hydroxylase n=1 Tax=Burkholderia paludis TaxID=1506587 RepID=A0A6J5F8E0_9BURK|nr:MULTISPECIES: bifunctional 3-(3-hydroxy-phenyl)propionate/3-hydroxycinnamic acid hydroxylase [Burkholderia]CAB3773515.1 putative NADH-specific resorcinol 4-hydroxylase [Burkholderia paludis]VWC28571.1 3-(3-hydroxyphenyl)propionate hydroxylase [Burkholderia paludis]
MVTQQDHAAPDAHDFYDVAVIGYGPTGLVAASLLGQAGYRVMVVERWPAMYGLPRLTHIDGETARIVQACGDVDQAMRDALGLHTYHYVNADGELLLELEWKGKQCGYTAHNAIYQPDIEDAIHDRVAAMSNVDLLRGWEAVFLKQGDDSVTIAIQRTNTAKDGVRAGMDEQWSSPAKSFHARYVIGADGANSFVRRSLGIERNDYGHKHRWLNLDSENLSDAAERFKQLTIFCDPARGHMYMPIGESRTRFEVRLLDGESVEDWEDPARGWRWLQEKYGVGPQDFRFLRNVVYTFQTRMAERWREGNVLLGGDAAHAMMPYMGQGACSGMRDGINLAWKLDLVLSGRAAPALLDSYEAERRPHARKIMEMSLFLGQVTNEDDPREAAARDEAFRTRTMPPMPAFPKVECGVVHREPDGSLLPSTGAPGPQACVRHQGREGRLDDVMGHGFLLVAHEDPAPFLAAGQCAFLARLGCRIVVLSDDERTPGAVTDLDGEVSGFMTQHGIAAYIGRPDFVIFGSVRRMSDLAALVDDLRRTLHWTDGAQDSEVPVLTLTEYTA